MKKSLKYLLLATCMTFAIGSLASCGGNKGNGSEGSSIEEPIHEHTVTGIVIETQPEKTEYKAGEPFSARGMVVKATCSDCEDKIPVTEYQIVYEQEGATSITKDDTYVTVKYGEFTAKVNITIAHEHTLTGIEIATQPTKTEYGAGETFNAEGMTVKTTCSTCEDKDEVTDYEIVYEQDGATSVTYGDTYVTVKYGDFTAQVTITTVKGNYDMSAVVFEDKEVEYNGQAQSIEATNLPEGVTVTYEGSATNVADGEVTVTATFATTNEAYNTPEPMTATIKITAKQVAVAWTKDAEYVYTDTTLTAPTATYTDVTGATVNCTVQEKDGKTMTEKGTYTFNATTTDTNYELPDTTTSVKVYENNAITLNVGTVHCKGTVTPMAITKDSKATFTFATEENGEYKTLSELGELTAGTYYVKATVADTEYYKGVTKTQSFEVTHNHDTWEKKDGYDIKVCTCGDEASRKFFV